MADQSFIPVGVRADTVGDALEGIAGFIAGVAKDNLSAMEVIFILERIIDRVELAPDPTMSIVDMLKPVSRRD